MSHQERLNFQALGMTAFDGITELPGQQATHPPQDRRTLTTSPNVTNVTSKRLALPEPPERPPKQQRRDREQRRGSRGSPRSVPSRSPGCPEPGDGSGEEDAVASSERDVGGVRESSQPTRKPSLDKNYCRVMNKSTLWWGISYADFDWREGSYEGVTATTRILLHH